MYSVTTNEGNGCRVRLHSGRLCAMVAMILAVAAAQAPGQCTEQQKLTASDAAAGGEFGSSVSVSGDTAVLGAPVDDCAAGVDCGAAYVLRFNGTSWVEEQKLTASDAGEFNGFGISVSVSGDTALVGASGDDCAAGRRCGSAYVFRFDGTSWAQEQKLTASDAAALDFFGSSVSVGGDTAVVGAWFDNCTAGDDCGSAYVFRFNGTSWVEEQKLTASDAGADDWFGRSVSVSGNTAVVGAVWDDCAAGDKCGSAYIYRFNGTSWVEQQKLTASDAGANDFFGSFVSVTGGTAVVGASGHDCAAGDDCGSAYVFRFNGTSWIERQKLTAPDAAANNWFGHSVSVSGETVVVGASGDDCATGLHCGAAYVFSCAFPTVVNLDIKPGSCPNPVNPKARGVVPVAVVGSLDFDVATVEPDSLTLARADGVGTDVSPLAGRRGRDIDGRRDPGIAIEDVATPSDGELCACHEPAGDGIDDLLLKFSTFEMSRALELNALPRGTTIELVLRGSLQDGTTFEAVDCIVIPGTPRDPRGLRSTGKPD